MNIPENNRKKIEKLLFFAGHIGTGTQEERDTAKTLAEKLCAQYSLHTSDFGSDTFKKTLQQKSKDYNNNIREVSTYGHFIVVSEMAETFGFVFEYFNNGSFVFKHPQETTYIEMTSNGSWFHYNQFGQVLAKNDWPVALIVVLTARTSPVVCVFHCCFLVCCC